MLLEQAIEVYIFKLTCELIDQGFNYDGSVVSDGINKAFKSMSIDVIKDFIEDIESWDDVNESDSDFLATNVTMNNTELVAFMFNFCPAWVNHMYEYEINNIGEYFDELR